VEKIEESEGNLCLMANLSTGEKTAASTGESFLRFLNRIYGNTISN